MKKIQCSLLAFLIAVMMMPSFAFAVDTVTNLGDEQTVGGPTSSEELDIASAPDVETISEDDLVDMLSYVLVNVGNTAKYVYATNPYIKTQDVANMRYDELDNTLYLTNYSNQKCQIVVHDMGEDFKICVQGTNKIRNIVVFGSAFTKEMGLQKDHIFDADLLITGLGDLEINANRDVSNAVQFICSGAKCNFTIDPKTNVFAKSGSGGQVFAANDASEGPSFILPEYNGLVIVGRDYVNAQTEAYMLEEDSVINCIPYDTEKYPGEYGYVTSYEGDLETGKKVYYELKKDSTDKLIALPLTEAADADFNTNQDEYEADFVQCYTIAEKPTSVDVYAVGESLKYAVSLYLTQDDVFVGQVYNIYEESTVEGLEKVLIKQTEQYAKDLPDGWTATYTNDYYWKASLYSDQYNHVNCLHNGNSVKVYLKAVAATYFAAGRTAEYRCVDCGDIRTPSKVIAKKTFVTSSLKAGKKSFTASWKKAAGATGYSIKYSLNKNMKNYKKKLVKSKYLKGTVKNLKSKKTYYVQVRAYKKVNGKYQYSNWSAVKSVKTK